MIDRALVPLAACESSCGAGLLIAHWLGDSFVAGPLPKMAQKLGGDGRRAEKERERASELWGAKRSEK